MFLRPNKEQFCLKFHVVECSTHCPGERRVCSGSVESQSPWDSELGDIEDSISQCTFLQMTCTAENQDEQSRIVLPPEIGEQPSLSPGLTDTPCLNSRTLGPSVVLLFVYLSLYCCCLLLQYLLIQSCAPGGRVCVFITAVPEGDEADFAPPWSRGCL